MKYSLTIIIAFFTLTSLSAQQSTAQLSEAAISQSMWHFAGEVGVFTYNECFGTSKGLSFQGGNEKLALRALGTVHSGQDLLTELEVDFATIELSILKKIDLHTMRWYISGGVGFVRGDLTPSLQEIPSSESGSLNANLDESFSFPVELGMEIPIGKHLGLGLSGFVNPNLVQSFGGIKARLLFGKVSRSSH